MTRHNYPAQCVNPDCTTPPRPTTGRANTCPQCEDHLRNTLWSPNNTGIGQLWEELERNLTPTNTDSTTDKGKQTHGMIAVGTQIDERVSQLRADTTAHVWWLTRTVAQALHDQNRNPTPPNTIPELCKWLAGHTPTITGRLGTYSTQNALTETNNLHRRIRAAINADPARTYKPGLPCDAPDCNGEMSATFTTDGPMPSLTCTHNPRHSIPPDVWSRPSWKHAHPRQTP